MQKRGYCCFECGKPGHFKSDCPERFGSGKQRGRDQSGSSPEPVTSTKEFCATNCPCGGGLCEINYSSKSGHARAFYSCPGKYEMKCNYFKWCKGLKEVLDYQPWPYPICPCKAGVCRLETEKQQGPNAGRNYFACNIKKGDGACNFRQWCDEYYQSANEIIMICKALENGEMDLDFPLPNEESQDEVEVNDSDQEIFAGDYDSSSSPSPRNGQPLDASCNGSLSESKTDGKMENCKPTTFNAILEELAIIDYDDKDWWWP